MRQLPVKQLTAEQIELSGRLLLSQNGDLLFDNRIIAYYEDLIDVLVVTDRAEFNTLTPKVGDVSKIAETGESYIYNGVWIALHRDKVTTYNILYESELSDLSPRFYIITMLSHDLGSLEISYSGLYMPSLIIFFVLIIINLYMLYAKLNELSY